jgi:hypothetical protein
MLPSPSRTSYTLAAGRPVEKLMSGNLRLHKFALFLRFFASISGVEKRRSDSSLPVAIGGAFATPPQSGLT